jgi:hypothetical protein
MAATDMRTGSIPDEDTQQKRLPQVCELRRSVLSRLAGSSLGGSDGSFERPSDKYTPSPTNEFENPEGTIRNGWVG